MACKPFTNAVLPAADVAADLAAAHRIDNSAVGALALYLPGKLRARAAYIPLAKLQRAYLRVMVGERRHGNFNQPLLVLVVDEKEIVFLYKRESVVKELLAALAEKGVATGKPATAQPGKE